VTAPTLENLEAERRATIADSGWGRSFTLWQPRNLAFWVYLALVLSGVWAWVSMISGQYAAYGHAIVLAVELFAIYGALFWWFTHSIDRYARQPIGALIAAFLWGGFGATWQLAAAANTALLALYAKAFGQAWALDWGAGLAAPFTEEIAKGAGLLLLIALGPRLVRTAFDGFILGAFIGLGFQIMEDIAYAVNSAASQFGANQIGAELPTIWLRIVFGVAAHTLYSAVFGAGLIYLIGRPAEPRRPLRGLALIATAMLLHGVWDDLAALVQGRVALLFLAWIVVPVVALLVAVKVFGVTVRREREFLRRILAPEVATGVVTPQELTAMCGDRKDRKAFRKSLPDRRIRRLAGHVLDAAADLADALANSHGTTTPAVEFARSEVTRIRSGRPPLSRDADPVI
jgi:protease PrsW